MFFEEGPVKDPKAVELAKKLNKMLHIKGVTSKTNLNKLHLLTKKHGSEKVGKVLEWYESHKQDPYTPQVNNLTQFYAKFDNIVLAMNRTEVEDRPEDIVEVRYIEWCTKFLESHSLPPEIAGNLYTIIKLTDGRWDYFCSGLCEVFTDNQREHDFLVHIFKQEAPVFVDNWLIHLHNKHGWKANCLLPVSKLAWKWDHPDFKESFWRKWAQDWCGDVLAFDNLLQNLIEELKDAS